VELNHATNSATSGDIKKDVLVVDEVYDVSVMA
jgi:hypothetical protein